MASLNVLVKFLTSSPFRLSLWRSSLPFCLLSLFPSSSISSLGYARGNYLVLQPRFYRLPRVRHSVRSHIFSRSVFSALFPFCLQYFLSFILLLWLYFFPILSLLFFFCRRSWDFSLTRESNSLSDYRWVF